MRNSDPSTSRLGPDRPFPGLRPYGFADHEYFFGREEQVFALYRLLDRSRFTAVVGTSGSGKSSLVRAGLLPLLQEETDEARARRWKWFQIRPGNTPIAQLANALAGRRPDTADEPELAIHRVRRETIEALLRRSSFGLREAVGELDEFADHSVLIVVDQFEEIFRYAELDEIEDPDHLARESRRHEAEAFVQLLLEASRDPSRPIHIMVTMRSDYMGDCARFYGLPEAVAASQYLVPSLTRDQREEAICGPIALVGAHIDGELVQRLLNDGSGVDDQLPVLQHALMRTWDHAGRVGPVPGDGGGQAETPPVESAPRRLTIADYEAIGTVSRALSQHADELMSELTGVESVVEEVFRALAELDRDSRAIRRPLPFDRLLAETGAAEVDLRRVLDRFRDGDCSFLVPAFPYPLTGNTVIDIGHEALIRRWDRIGAKSGPSGPGWLWQEAEDGNYYRGLLALAGGESAVASSTLPLDQVEARWRWWTARPRTGAWASRYGGHLSSVQRLFDNSRAAMQATRERKRKAEMERRRRMRRAVAAAAGSIALAVLATIGLGWALFEKTRADNAVVNVRATAIWSRFQLYRDPLPQADVDALWDLAQADEKVRVASVDLLGEPAQLKRFGMNPLPVARAVGLRWPSQARERAIQAVTDIAKNGLAMTDDTSPFALIAYARAVAFLAHPQRVGSGKNEVPASDADQARANIAKAIVELTSQPGFNARDLWAVAEMVDVVGDWIPDETMRAAQHYLRDGIAQADAKPDPWTDRAIGRAIEVMAPFLDTGARQQAVGLLRTRLAGRDEGRRRLAIPRALVTLIALDRDPAEVAQLSADLPKAIANSAARKDRTESAYLLTLTQVAETVGDKVGRAADAELARGFAEQLAQAQGARVRGALARAAIPLLRLGGGSYPELVDRVAQATFGERASGEVGDTTTALRQALTADSSAARSGTEAVQAVVASLLKIWADYPAANEAYVSAAQLRLLATLAPLLDDATAAQAARNLLIAFWRPVAARNGDESARLPERSADCSVQRRSLPDDYFAREAMARALRALAPKLSPQTQERNMGLCVAKAGLASTGSREEASAWAQTVVALLPADRDAFTAGVVEVLKYPTAAGAATEPLLGALAQRWPDADALRGKKELDPEVLTWLERQPGGLLAAPVALPVRSPDTTNLAVVQEGS